MAVSTVSNQSMIAEVGRSFKAFARDIKIAHTIFALPFAASTFLIADLAIPTTVQAFWLLIAMISARSFAMGFNRWADRNYDLRNDRTAARQIPAGNISAPSMLAWSLVAGSILVVSAFQLNTLSGYCSFPLLIILALYSYWKRFSYLTHWYLGFCLGLSPTAVGISLAGNFYLELIWLGVAIMMWTAGFDIIYALQDREFDVSEKLKSIPASFGPRKSIYISRLCFITMIAILVYVGTLASRGWLYYMGLTGIGIILVYEHYLVRNIVKGLPSPKLGVAFFNMNAYVSVLYFVVTAIDQLFILKG